MRIAILSRAGRSYSTRRLREAALARGFEVQVMDTLKFSILIERDSPALFYRHRRLREFDAVIPRIGASITFYGLAVVRQFEQMGVYVLNDSMAIARSRDKLRAVQMFSRHDIGLPPTAFVRDRDDVLHAVRRVGGVPVIIKLLEGTQGVGVILAETEKVAEAIIQTLHSARQNVLIQKFVKESQGQDIRALVVGDHVVAAMKRMAQPGEFRSNVHRGGSTEAVTLDAEYERTAVRAAQVMGLRVAGVDMLVSESGPQVLEVNSSPGFEGIEKATGIDVAGTIIRHLEQQVLSPEVDLRQRLALAGGYGIAEFTVHGMPHLENKALRDTALSAHNIHVMLITRHDHVIANPKADDVIRQGDALLCFGELSELRLMMPERKRRGRRRRE
ncbi:MAG TPA: 30S ribosomal protein S6--L-glutamate ligase [Candidatus Hydrogenedentes bacterium]|nr:30S ribosomal protein S6--L-glutamate ligase [Candidatus Hydrogenedentota bacterium]